MLRNIGIIGLGLIGGSLAKCFRERTDGVYITAMNRSEKSLTDAYSDGVIDQYSLDDMSVFSQCDIVFVCTPVDRIPYYVERLLPVIKKDCIITDVGSTKKKIYDRMLSFEGINFIGGHPMAGSEKTSYKSAKAHLFENAFYILTPNDNITQKQLDDMTELIKYTGAMPIVLDSDYHDYIVAAVSHMPHIIASALVNTIREADDEKEYMHSLAAGGFKDITRIASSSPEVWSSICDENSENILKMLQSFKKSIEIAEEKIRNSESLYDFFDAARNYRNSFSSKAPITQDKVYEIFVDVTDTPGAIAKIATLLMNENINITNIGIVNNREYSDGALQIIFSDPQAREKAADILRQTNHVVLDRE